MMLDELLQFKSPITRKQGILQDACGNQIRLYEAGWRGIESLLIQAVNRIHEMRVEMHCLKASNAVFQTANAVLKADVDALRFVEKCIKDTEAENERIKAKVAELEHEKERIQINSESAFEAHCVVENDRVQTQRRFEAAVAIRSHDGCSAERAIEEADKLLAALDKPQAPPEPPSAEVWRIDENESRPGYYVWWITNGEKEDDIRVEGVTRNQADRIVAALNGGER